MSLLEFQNIHFVPAIHQRMAFADEVRHEFERGTFDCVAVELPPGLKELVTRGVMRLPQLSVVCHPSDDPGEMFFIPVDPCDAMIEAIRQALFFEIPVEFIDDSVTAANGRDAVTPHEIDLPDDAMIASTGLAPYVETILPFLREAREVDAPDAREEGMARRLAALAKRHARILCVLGFAHLEPVRRRVEALLNSSAAASSHDDSETLNARFPGALLAHVHPQSVREVLREIPALAAAWEAERPELPAGGRFEKMAALLDAIKEAEESYRFRYDTDLSLARQKAMVQFMRNWSIVNGRLQPELYHAVIAARNCGDGDFAHEVLLALRSYDWQDEESALPIFKMRNGRGSFSGREERYRMTDHAPRPETRTVKLNFRRRPPDEMLKQWKEEWQEGKGDWGICSWPPEDEAQERFMTFLRRRALEVVGEDKKRTVEFSTSMLDGLDIRETMRNWHKGTLFVKEAPQPQGQVGAVVLIFDDPARDAAYPWRCTLYAENQNESDISFYATPLGEKVVGPRIARTEFGGILSVYPANGLPDVWRMPFAEQLKSCAEVLLAGAIMFSDHRFVAHVARKPPGSLMRELAARYNRYIIHIPIHGFSETQLKKIRNFHILSGRDVRNWAADYIFE